ncbi:MAG: hypothetical protein ACRENE_10090 [Polyangiaceae bacterium]
MSTDLGYGCLYVGAYQAWAWVFGSVLDPRLRALAGRRHGVQVAWVPTTTFPVDIWAWGSAHGDAARGPLEDRLAAYCAALCVTGAFLPVLVLGAVLDQGAPSARLSGLLYLATMPLMLLFLRVQTRRREAPARKANRRDGVYRPNEGGVP